MMYDEIVNYCIARWPHLHERAVRRTIRRVAREENKSGYDWTPAQRRFDILVRVTQLYEASECDHK